jgi:hypothetical protein
VKKTVRRRNKGEEEKRKSTNQLPGSVKLRPAEMATAAKSEVNEAEVQKGKRKAGQTSIGSISTSAEDLKTRFSRQRLRAGYHTLCTCEGEGLAVSSSPSIPSLPRPTSTRSQSSRAVHALVSHLRSCRDSPAFLHYTKAPSSLPAASRARGDEGTTTDRKRRIGAS